MEPSTEEFFIDQTPPLPFEQDMGRVRSFVELHSKKRPFALVTSGGTRVPLERFTVRSLENFVLHYLFVELKYALDIWRTLVPVIEDLLPPSIFWRMDTL